MDRVEKYLSSLVQNPETWVRITAPQRDEIMSQVKQTLDLMGIPYEDNWHGPYTIRVLK